MTFYKFEDNDMVTTTIVAHPYYTVENNDEVITGSVHLERMYIPQTLRARIYQGLDEWGHFKTRQGPFSSSVHLSRADSDGTIYNTFHKQNYGSITNLYEYHNFYDSGYTASYGGSAVDDFRLIFIPEIYYDKEILTGSFTASDIDNEGNARLLYDNGRGGIYSGSVTGTLVGNIFYSEGIVALKGGGLNDFDSLNAFGSASLSDFKWRVQFRGTHRIPVNIFKCRAPAGELNASLNETFYTVPTGTDDYSNQRKIVVSNQQTYITKIGIYDEDYNLVAVSHLAQPIRKRPQDAILFRLKIDR